MTRVLFVCLGNICRSPMAEGLFNDYAKKQGLSHLFYFESRSTASWEQGNPPHPKTVELLKKHGISLGNKKSQRISEKDFIDYDYIIGMDKMNMKYLNDFEDGYYHHKVYSYLPKKEVPDPYITGRYQETYELLMSELENWFEKWMKENQ